MAALQTELGGLDIGPLLRRAPRLISRSPEHVRCAMAELRALTDTVGVSAEALVETQPSLLLYSSVGGAVGPKLAALRALTSEEEWEKLAGARSLSRILTCSLERIEQRLSRRPAQGARTGVAWRILTTEAKFDEWLRARGGKVEVVGARGEGEG